MSTIKFRLSRQARTDLERIADYLAKRSPDAAERVLDTLLEAFEFLGENPLAGVARDDLHPHLRMFVPRRPAASFSSLLRIETCRKDGIDHPLIDPFEFDGMAIFPRDMAIFPQESSVGCGRQRPDARFENLG